MSVSQREDRVIERKLEFEVPMDRVWAALTDPGELAAWFSDEADFLPRPGYEGSLTWEGHGRFPLRVEEVEEPTRLVWRWTHEAGGEFSLEESTLVEWTLTATEAGGTVLELRESGFRTDEHHQENEGGWTAELGHLAAFVEPGRGPAFRANTDVAIHVPDLELAVDFYVRGLGLELVDRSDDHLEIDAGALRLWVNRGDGPRGFVPSFDVADRGAALARLRGVGAEPVRAGGTVYARDPWGNALDVIERG